MLATNSIRGGKNRQVLQRIRESGDIFFAESDRPWILDGAAVRVSMVGFDSGSETERLLDGVPVDAIYADLTGPLDLSAAVRLPENAGIGFVGTQKGGSFDIPAEVAAKMLSAPVNPNARPNSDVVKPWINGLDITRRPRDMWIIDFGVSMSEGEAALYEAPFEYISEHVRDYRTETKSEARTGAIWWLHQRPRPEMRQALEPLTHFIVTTRHAKHLMFSKFGIDTVPDSALIIFAREDDYFFGVLHSQPHELWARRMGTHIGVGNDLRYTPTSCFETFPLPWPPGEEPAGDPRVEEISAATKRLDELRRNRLDPEGITEAELKKRTLTNLYNACPAWLQNAHERLDRAVLAAYGWPAEISDEDILKNLLALNRERSKARSRAGI